MQSPRDTELHGGRTTWRQPYHLAMICVEAVEAAAQLGYVGVSQRAAIDEVVQHARFWLHGGEMEWTSQFEEPAGVLGLESMQPLHAAQDLVDALWAWQNCEWSTFDRSRQSCLHLCVRAGLAENTIERISTKWMVKMLAGDRELDPAALNAATAAWRAQEFLLAAELLGVDAQTHRMMRTELEEM